MFYEVPDGTIHKIPDNAFGFDFDCWVPPVGFGKNIMTGELCKTDILKRSEIPEEQYFERIKLPDDYAKKRKPEAERQKFDPFYFDPSLEAFRTAEWNRRLCGVWFWNYNPYKKQSELIYITGLHWFYINWWKFDGRWNNFRTTDRDFFYVVAYCIEDPCCLGLNEIAKRKQGKTARGGCILYERASRLSNHHAGIQSKTDDDAEEVFDKAIIAPWKILPHFYRPIFDLTKGDTPSEELKFFDTAVRGTRASEEEYIEDRPASLIPLNSFIDFKSRKEDGYDGPLVLTYLSDESGKLKKDVSILERQKRVRFSREDVGHYADTFHLFTTTVEIEDGAKEEDYNDEFEQLTHKSNPLKRDGNGHTGTGLYTYFTPAFKSMFFDPKYGHPDQERAKVYFLNTRKQMEEEGDLRGLSSFKRKNPFTLNEAFSADGAKSLYNPELLNGQLDNIKWRTDLTEFGDLKWFKGYEVVIPEMDAAGNPIVDEQGNIKKWLPNKVIWEANPKGLFEKVVGWWPKEPNKVYENNGAYLPNNNHAFRIGYDTFKYDKTKKKKRSDAAAFAYQIADSLYPDEFDDMFVLRYCHRPESRRKANMDVLIMAWLCGCQMLVERNAGDHYKEHYLAVGCYGFLMMLPGEVEPGIMTNSSGSNKTVDTICNYTEAYINEHIGKVYFKNLISKEKGWLGFKVEDTEEFDEPMGAGITLVAVKGKKYRKQSDLNQKIESILPYRKAV